MGIIYAPIELGNPRKPDLSPVAVSALVDTGAVHLCIPEHVALQLDLQELEKREVTFADGRKQLVPYSGPIEVRFGKRHCFTGALILGDTPLLGAIPMEDMDLVIHPATQQLSINPASPNYPSALVK